MSEHEHTEPEPDERGDDDGGEPDEASEAAELEHDGDDQ